MPIFSSVAAAAAKRQENKRKRRNGEFPVINGVLQFLGQIAHGIGLKQKTNRGR